MTDQLTDDAEVKALLIRLGSLLGHLLLVRFHEPPVSLGLDFTEIKDKDLT